MVLVEGDGIYESSVNFAWQNVVQVDQVRQTIDLQHLLELRVFVILGVPVEGVLVVELLPLQIRFHALLKLGEVLGQVVAFQKVDIDVFKQLLHIVKHPGQQVHP